MAEASLWKCFRVRWTSFLREPILYNSDRRPEPFTIQPEGQALGLLDPKYFFCRSFPVKLRKGDLFLIYTDGVIEAMNEERELFGEERLLKAVIKHSNKKLSELLGSIEEEIIDFSGSQLFEDDVTLIAIRVV